MSFGIRDFAIHAFVENASKFGAHVDALLARDVASLTSMDRDVGAVRTTLGGLYANTENLSIFARDALAALPQETASELQRTLARSWAISDQVQGGEVGADFIPALQALRQSVGGVAELLGSQTAAVRPTRVVVGGGGTAGLTTANLLRGMGAEVTLVSLMPDARRGSVMVDRRAWGVLEQAGAGRAISRAAEDPTGDYRMTSIAALEQPLRGRAAGLGVDLRYSREIAGVEELEDGVRVSVRHTSHPDDPAWSTTIDADWYVDATGGRSPVAKDPAFAREPFTGTFGALPSARTFLAANADAVPDRPIGWTAPDGSFAINNAQEGLLTAYRGLDEAAGDGAASAEEGAALLRALDVDPSTAIGEPWTFTARQTLARSAAQGRKLIVGDGAGTVMPVTQSGILLAALDAERAAKTIMGVRAATAEEVSRAVARYDEEWQLARADGALFPDPAALDDIVEDASTAVDSIVERASDAHDAGTRGMHRAFLA